MVFCSIWIYSESACAQLPEYLRVLTDYVSFVRHFNFFALSLTLTQLTNKFVLPNFSFLHLPDFGLRLPHTKKIYIVRKMSESQKPKLWLKLTELTFKAV